MRFPSGLECWLPAGKSQVMSGGTAGRGRARPVVIFDRTVTLAGEGGAVVVECGGDDCAAGDD